MKIIEFGTVYQATYDPERANGKYVVTQVDLESIGAGFLDETGDIPKLRLPGTHPVSDVEKVLKTMTFEEVLFVAANCGWLVSGVEEVLRDEKGASKQIVI